MPKTNAAGVALIEEFEGLRLTAYQDSGGVLTIGYGHTGPDVHAGLTITQAQAQALLQLDLHDAETQIADAVEIELTPNQFSALVSWEFNTGGILETSGLELINARAFVPAWDEHLALWVTDADGTELPGLVRRRAAERALFFTPG